MSTFERKNRSLRAAATGRPPCGHTCRLHQGADCSKITGNNGVTLSRPFRAGRAGEPGDIARGAIALKRSWKRQYAEKLVTAIEALSHIRNGQTIIIGSGAGEPLLLTQTLAETGRRFCDIEVIHLTSARGDSPLASRELADSFRYNTFFIGRHGARSTDGVFTDFTPMNLSELPAAMAGGVIVVDVALVQVSPPDPLGLCSLGVSVDATKAAVENAKIVIAQVNEQMPITVGDTMVPADAIDYMVEGNAPLIEVAPPELDPISLTIGRHVASLIGDGTTLHFDRGPISAATMRYLDTRKDLGIHTDILTDDLLRLIESGAVTNRKKRINRGKSVATMAMGSRRLYDRLVGTPYIELLPIDQVTSPRIISLNDNAVAVLSVEEMELTGLARSDTEDVLVNRSLLSTID